MIAQYFLAEADPPIAICVPVRNEEAVIASLLSALVPQLLAYPGRVVLGFFLDGCTDGSGATLESARLRLPFEMYIASGAATREANVGLARSRAVDLGLAAFADRGDGILLSTDADCVPAPDWVARNVAALALADVVAGRIEQLPDGKSLHHDRIEAYFDRLHMVNRIIDPVPWEAPRTQHYAAAASLCLTADTYRALGGFPALPRGEDLALIDAAGWHGLKVRRDAGIAVHTSTRRIGRVSGGFADHLRMLDDLENPAAFEVVDPRVALAHYRQHAHARQAFASPRAALSALADDIGKDLEVVHRVAEESPNAEAFATRIANVPHAAPPLPLGEAEPILDALLRVYVPKLAIAVA